MGCPNCGDHELRIEINGQEPDAPDPRCVRQLENMGMAGQLELTFKSFQYPHDNWHRLCSLEGDLLHDPHKHAGPEDWFICTGEVVALPGITGWLEYTDALEDHIIVPYGCELRESRDAELGVYTREAWRGLFPMLDAMAPVSDASGLVLNRTKREIDALEAAWGD